MKNFVPTAIAEVTVDNTQHNPDIASMRREASDLARGKALGLMPRETTQYAERYPLGHTPQLSTQSVLLGDIVQNLSQGLKSNFSLSELRNVKAIAQNLAIKR